jgi:anthranilate phosphoribosyltransferase
MNRDDIIRMAREQGDFIDDKRGGAFIFNGDPEHTFNIFKFAALVAAAEREACAKIVDRWHDGPSSEPEMAEIAAEIRARGNSEKP